MTPLVVSHGCLILDACCTINLYASGQMSDILTATSIPVAVAKYVHEREALRIAGRIGPQGQDPPEPIDLQPLISQGVVTIVDLASAAESLSFVNFAASMDDGEAITGAIALHRNWAIATDDGRATRFFTQVTPHLQLVTTPELIKYWADVTQPAANVLRTVLQDVRMRARYAPHTQHPLNAWWRAHE